MCIDISIVSWTSIEILTIGFDLQSRDMMCFLNALAYTHLLYFVLFFRGLKII